jgi:hypothetical protein
MESKGLAIHNPRSYDETLACYPYAAYHLRFLRTMACRWASVFHSIWLGHVNMKSKFLAMHSPRNPFYSETLACCPRAVYPLDFFGQRHTGGLVCLALVTSYEHGKQRFGHA